jgi:hypothetical protein
MLDDLAAHLNPPGWVVRPAGGLAHLALHRPGCSP